MMESCPGCDLLPWLVLPGLLVFLGYWYLTQNHQHWKKQNVPSLPDPLPIFGHMLPVITLRDNIGTFAERLHWYNKDASMLGFHFMGQPALLVREAELVKIVLQANFSSFRSNLLQLSERNDPVLSKNPFFINEPGRWKETRMRIGSHLTGTKLGRLFVIVDQVVRQMKSFTDRRIGSNGFYECELKGYFVRCTGEVVANAAFAIHGQSFEDQPERLSFYEMAKTIFEPTTINGIKQALLFYLPAFGELLGVSFLQKSTDAFFRENVTAIIKQRREQNASEPPSDFLQYCIDAAPEQDIDAIVADVIIFYMDMYETSSTSLASIFYQLSRHPDIQAKLREHVTEVVQSEGDGRVTYESLKRMTYLDQVINEALRILSPLGALTKLCSEPIRLTGSDGITCELRPGDPVFVSIQALHLDEKYWPDPERFDPDRFAAENEAQRNKMAFLVFGEGPRMCVGMRLGLMVVKMTIANLLMNYQVEASPKTKLPLEIDPTSIVSNVKGGLWARFQKLDQ
ncbi:hypothetical protein TSAR_005269 [Trichomalopsis sarcophagae]|uniref:Cytochrome P450 n=1 Tax=Trichomalopsis sarcophagae TaxID=543379 RepID=A0A232EQW9_9HYME|nr:hypothetical protein TSAR_005269 [Trichomalopsis sarcophagae]